jgi:hypothetical protein
LIEVWNKDRLAVTTSLSDDLCDAEYRMELLPVCWDKRPSRRWLAADRTDLVAQDRCSVAAKFGDFGSVRPEGQSGLEWLAIIT